MIFLYLFIRNLVYFILSVYSISFIYLFESVRCKDQPASLKPPGLNMYWFERLVSICSVPFHKIKAILHLCIYLFGSFILSVHSSFFIRKGALGGEQVAGACNTYLELCLPWREAGPPNHHDDKVVSDQ